MIPSVARNRQTFINEQRYYEENEKPQKNIIQNMAKMQHDGIPTRLLDFSTDPLVALFFATQEKERADASVYLLIRHSYDAESEEVKFSSFVATRRNRCLENLVNSFNEKRDNFISIQKAEQILKHGIFIRPNTINDVENQRMIEQKGTFAIPGNQIKNGNVTDVVPFENDSSYEEIVIPFEYQEEIRQELSKRGYTKSRLLGEKDEIIRYKSLPENNNRKIDGKYIRKVYCQYSVTIEMINLMTANEIKEVGYQIARNSGANSTWIWFRRIGFEMGNNIMTQHWYQKSINRYEWQGIEYKELMLEEDRRDAYISYDYFQEKLGRIKYKHLPVEANAKLINLDISLLNRSKLILKTNLVRGTKLLVFYKIDGEIERSTEVLVKEASIEIDIDTSHPFSLLEGEVTMPVSAVQDMNVVEAYGVDYERIKGDFIKRSDDSSTSGYKEFKIRC